MYVVHVCVEDCLSWDCEERIDFDWQQKSRRKKEWSQSLWRKDEMMGGMDIQKGMTVMEQVLFFCRMDDSVHIPRCYDLVFHSNDIELSLHNV
jgi:hypothetical protein